MKVIENYILQTYGRKYEPEAGRFLSIDPLWETPPAPYPGWTPYHYCGNDPVNLKDVDEKKLVYPKNKEERTKYIKMLELLKLTSLGNKFASFAEKIPININLKFGSLPTDKGGQIAVQGRVDKNKLVSVTITLRDDRTFNDVVGIVGLGHEFNHVYQYYNNLVYWNNSSTNDNKNKIDHDRKEIEQEPNRTKQVIIDELTNTRPIEGTEYFCNPNFSIKTLIGIKQ